MLSLAIADLRVELRCNDQRLTDQLQARYHRYLDAGTPHLVADVHRSGRSHSGSLADASVTFADGTLHLAAPGYDGAVDVKQGRARLQLSSAVGRVLVPRRSPDDGARGRGVKRRPVVSKQKEREK